MTLQEKLCKPIGGFRRFTAAELEKIADKHAIEFSKWKDANATKDIDGLYYGESRIGVSRNNPVNINQLLEIYKKEKGL